MEQNEKILSLCESCINSLKSALATDLPVNISMSLNQKLFLLETGLEDLRRGQNQDVETSSATLHDISGNTVAPYFHYLEKSGNLKDAVTEFEKDIICAAIEEQGSKRKAATALGMDHSTLIKKCQRYGI